MWCIIEILTFLKCGGNLGNLVILPLASAAARTPEESAAHCRALFHDFDVNNATCFDPSEREKFLAVIAASFGDAVTFNAFVRNKLAPDEGGSSGGGRGDEESEVSWSGLTGVRTQRPTWFRGSSNFMEASTSQRAPSPRRSPPVRPPPTKAFLSQRLECVERQMAATEAVAQQATTATFDGVRTVTHATVDGIRGLL